MKNVAVWCRQNPVRALAVVSAVLGAATPLLPAGVTTAALAVVAAVLGVGVHAAVTPVSTAAAQITQAAVGAATGVAANLSGDTAGTGGVITGAGQAVVNDVVETVVGALPLGRV